MQIPRKPITGENIKKYIFDTFSSIIDYLHASKIRPGNGIDVRETPCGTVISIIPRGSAIQGGAGGITYEAGTGITITGGTPGVPEKINANITGGNDISVTGGTNGNPLVISYTGGGGGCDVGIDSTVSGGTATVYLDGGTGSVVFTGENGIDISGGSFGEIIISGGTSGGGGGLTAVYIFGQTASYQASGNTDIYIGTSLAARDTQANYSNLIYGVNYYEIVFASYVETDGALWNTSGGIKQLDYSILNAYEGGDSSQAVQDYINAWNNAYHFSVGIMLPTGLSADCCINLHVGKESPTMVFCQDSTSGIVNSDNSGEWEEMQYLFPIIGNNVSLFYDHTRNIWFATRTY